MELAGVPSPWPLRLRAYHRVRMTMREMDHMVIKPNDGARGSEWTLAQQESGALASLNPTLSVPGDALGSDTKL